MAQKLYAEDAVIPEGDHSRDPIARVALGDIIRRSARRFPEKVAITDRWHRVTYQQLDQMSDSLAAAIVSMGISNGGSIATICRNSAAYMAAIFAINKSGRVWVPVNIMLAMTDIQYILQHSEAELLLVDREYAEANSSLIAESARQVLIIDPSSAEPFGVQAAHSSKQACTVSGDRNLAFVMYTSGTTAKAKGVMHSHLSVYLTLLSNIGEWSVTRDDRILICLPLFHIAGHTMVSTLLAAGGSVVLQDGYDPIGMVRAIEEKRVTMIFALPMMYAGMLEQKRILSSDTSSLRFCIYAMAPMPRTLIEALVTEFCPSFALTSGQTEVYPMTVMFRPEQQLRKFGTYWGESAGINDTAIMDDDGQLLPPGEVGEIVHRGPNVMLGYFKDPEATAEARRYGWHHTGDLGYFDEDGQLVFADRKKDMIKSGGENVPSVLVEEVLLQHPRVKQVAVIGVPHPRWTEAVFACVVLHGGEELDTHDIMQHARDRLGHFQVPKAIVSLPMLPSTATGKPIKAELRSIYMEYFA